MSILLFASPNECKACGVFNIKHLILLVITILLIIIAVKKTKITKKQDIRKIIKYLTILIWFLEIIKIIFNIKIGNINNLNTYIPLYYCSILLYAGILSSVFKGRLKRTGDIFIETGGIVAGFIFILFPDTSLNSYNVIHFISIQSFVYHGIMIYLGIIVNKYNYIKLEKKDIIYYFSLVISVGIIASLFNHLYDSNLMFLSKKFPGTFINIVYNIFGRLFPIVMLITQATLPFYLVYYILKIKNKYIDNKKADI